MGKHGTGGSDDELVHLPVDGPFSLAAAAEFGFGPNTGRPDPADGALMRLAFVTDDLRHQAGAVVRQDPGGDLTAEISGVTDLTAAGRQVRRILSVDRPAGGWVEAGRRDPVLGRRSRRPSRPAACAVPLSLRGRGLGHAGPARHRSQATALRRRLAEALGQPFQLAGRTEHAFPLPDRLLGLDSFPGLEPQRAGRLRGVAERALAGDLDAERLAAMDTDEALAGLRTIPGLGPFYAGLVQFRSTGVSDALPLGEPRLLQCLRHYYGLAEVPDDQTVRRIAEPWRPFRMWASVLIRASGDRDGVPPPARPAR